MASELVWTKRAIQGYDKIVNYRLENFTDREVKKFVQDSWEFFELMKDFPDLLQGPIDIETCIEVL